MSNSYTRFHLRPVCRLGVLAAAVSAATTGTADTTTDIFAVSASSGTALMMAQVGEGEGEGEGASQASVIDDDIAYLTQLGLIRGHLNVGVDLYRNGHKEMAVMHMKHPQDELYSALLPAFRARGVDDFDDALTALAERVEARASEEDVEAAYAEVQAHIDRAEQGAGARDDTGTQFRVVVNLMRTAADEYAIGVKDGQLKNAHEYQDALGFTRVARAIVEHIAAGSNPDGREDVARAVAAARTQLDGVEHLWDAGLMPPETVDRKASDLYGAAARVELAALSID